MFHIKVKLRKSKIHGIGLFADQEISKGANIYSENQKLDLLLSQEEFSELSQDEKNTISHYGYFDKAKGKWHLAFDDIRFCNHSIKSNMALHEGKIIAKRDIKKEEELTQDYREFEELRNDLSKK